MVTWTCDRHPDLEGGVGTYIGHHLVESKHTGNSMGLGLAPEKWKLVFFA